MVASLLAPGRSDLFITKKSAISIKPAFINCTSSPDSGTNTTTAISTAFITSYSPCPTPTVSKITISFPLAARISPTSCALFAKPPKSPREPMLRINTFSFQVNLFIRTRSPNKAPPVYGLVGSMAITPTDFLSSIIICIN